MAREIVAILSHHQSAGIRRCTDRVWRIDGHSGAIDDCKVALLDAATRHAIPVIRADDAPDEPGLERVERVGPGTWRVPRDTSASALMDWLEPGNWQLRVSEGPVAAPLDACRASDAEVERFLDERDVTLLIDSFHDDLHWVVALGAESQPRPS